MKMKGCGRIMIFIGGRIKIFVKPTFLLLLSWTNFLVTD